MLYIGSCSGSFYALDRGSGREVWSHDAALDSDRPNFHGNVVFVEDLVIVGTDSQGDGFLYGFDRNSGELRWRQQAPGGFPSDPVARGERGYVVTMGGEVRCFDLRSGETLWSFDGETGERLFKSALLSVDDRIVVSLPSGAVFALDAGSGKIVWKTSLPARLNTSLARVGEHLYVGSIEGSILRLAADDGSFVDAFELDAPVYGTLLSEGECLLALWNENTFACIDPQAGEVRWSRKTASVWSSFQPLVHGEIVIVGDESGELSAFRITDGEPVWTHELEGEIKGLGAHEDTLYVGTRQGRVYALPFPRAD